jgi:hypothetical protein
MLTEAEQRTLLRHHGWETVWAWLPGVGELWRRDFALRHGVSGPDIVAAEARRAMLVGRREIPKWVTDRGWGKRWVRAAKRVAFPQEELF